jgi:uncharacterized protein YcaQ
LPAAVLKKKTPTEHEARSELLLLAAKSLGIATASDLLDYHRQRPGAAKPVLAELVQRGELEQVRVEGWRDVAYMLPGVTRPRSVNTRALVSPFDSLVWCRPRIERLWDFHYRIEIYTPEHKRIYGYYVLPFVLGDRIVARVDLKADRQAGLLLVHGAYSEPDVDLKHVVSELAAELKLMAQWLGLVAVKIGDKGDLSLALSRLCR